MRAATNIFTAHCRAGLRGARVCWCSRRWRWPGARSVQRRGLDPLAVGGRLAAAPVSYEALMHIAAAARGGGDLETAVGLYRRAAELNPAAAAPFTAAGDTLVEMGQINEAIMAYRAALAREPRDPAALRGSPAPICAAASRNSRWSRSASRTTRRRRTRNCCN